MIEVGLRGSSLRIEANDQIEAIRLAKDAVLEKRSSDLCAANV
jgi:hypothetical protein